MYVAARSYLATGVAVVGASALAISPLSPVSTPLPDITVPAISSAAVELTSLANPLELWVQVLTQAVTNVGGLGTDWLSDPAPVLRQIATNQIANLEKIVAAGNDLVQGFFDYVSPTNQYGFQADIRRAVTQFQAGDIADAINTLAGAFIVGPILQVVGVPLLFSGVLDIPVQIAQNVTDAITELLNPANAATLLTGALGPILAPINALGATAQEIADSLATGNVAAAVTALVNIPAAVTGAFLNGFTGPDGNPWAGLLKHAENTFEGGLLQAILLTVPRAIAGALGANTSLAKTAATDEVSAIETDAAATVTLDVPGAAPAVVSEPAEEAATPEPSGAEPAVPVADDEPAEEPVAEEEPAEEEATEEEPATEEEAAEEEPAEEETVDEETPSDEETEAEAPDEDSTTEDSSEDDAASDTADDSGTDDSGSGSHDSGSEKTAAA